MVAGNPSVIVLPGTNASKSHTGNETSPNGVTTGCAPVPPIVTLFCIGINATSLPSKPKTSFTKLLLPSTPPKTDAVNFVKTTPEFAFTWITWGFLFGTLGNHSIYVLGVVAGNISSPIFLLPFPNGGLYWSATDSALSPVVEP